MLKQQTIEFLDQREKELIDELAQIRAIKSLKLSNTSILDQIVALEKEEGNPVQPLLDRVRPKADHHIPKMNQTAAVVKAIADHSSDTFKTKDIMPNAVKNYGAEIKLTNVHPVLSLLTKSGKIERIAFGEYKRIPWEAQFLKELSLFLIEKIGKAITAMEIQKRFERDYPQLNIDKIMVVMADLTAHAITHVVARRTSNTQKISYKIFEGVS